MKYAYETQIVKQYCRGKSRDFDNCMLVKQENVLAFQKMHTEVLRSNQTKYLQFAKIKKNNLCKG